MPDRDAPEPGTRGEVPGADTSGLCHLARLRLTPEEQRRFARDLKRILAYVLLIDEADSEGVPPTVHPAHTLQRLREDLVQPGLTAFDALRNAAHSKGAFFRAPRAIPDRRGRP